MHTFTPLFFPSGWLDGSWHELYISRNRQEHKPKQNNGNKEKFK